MVLFYHKYENNWDFLPTADIWGLPNRSELTPIIFNMELTHLGSKDSILSRVEFHYMKSCDVK